MVVIGIGWNLPFVVWLCGGPRFWPYFDLVAAGACFAFGLFSLAMSRSAYLQSWLYGQNPPPPAGSFYACAGLLTLFGMGGVLSAIFRG